MHCVGCCVGGVNILTNSCSPKNVVLSRCWNIAVFYFEKVYYLPGEYFDELWIMTLKS